MIIGVPPGALFELESASLAVTRLRAALTAVSGLSRQILGREQNLAGRNQFVKKARKIDFTCSEYPADGTDLELLLTAEELREPLTLRILDRNGNVPTQEVFPGHSPSNEIVCNLEVDGVPPQTPAEISDGEPIALLTLRFTEV